MKKLDFSVKVRLLESYLFGDLGATPINSIASFVIHAKPPTWISTKQKYFSWHVPWSRK